MVPSGRVKSISTSPAATALRDVRADLDAADAAPTAGLPRASSAAASCSDGSAQHAFDQRLPHLAARAGDHDLQPVAGHRPIFCQHAPEEAGLLRLCGRLLRAFVGFLRHRPSPARCRLPARAAVPARRRGLQLFRCRLRAAGLRGFGGGLRGLGGRLGDLGRRASRLRPPAWRAARASSAARSRSAAPPRLPAAPGRRSRARACPFSNTTDRLRCSRLPSGTSR